MYSYKKLESSYLIMSIYKMYYSKQKRIKEQEYKSIQGHPPPDFLNKNMRHYNFIFQNHLKLLVKLTKEKIFLGMNKNKMIKFF